MAALVHAQPGLDIETGFSSEAIFIEATECGRIKDLYAHDNRFVFRTLPHHPRSSAL